MGHYHLSVGGYVNSFNLTIIDLGTQSYSKKATSASLMIINSFMTISYFLLSLGIFPSLSFSSTGQMDAARYVVWMVLYPVIGHLVGDVTNNNSDMNW